MKHLFWFLPLLFLVVGCATYMPIDGSSLQSVERPAKEKTVLVPMKIADDYKNNYNFDAALEWYEKVIQDFPDTLEAGNASLNKLAILHSQAVWYDRLSTDFKRLADAQSDRISMYDAIDTLRDKLTKKRIEFLEKEGQYRRLALQKGKFLREEFYRFEKNYASNLGRLSTPYINLYTDKEPPIVFMKEEDIEELLLLGNDSYLEYESREKYSLFSSFWAFCFKHMILGGDSPTAENAKLYLHKKKYSERKINPIGFYFWLGIGLDNSYQYKAAYKCYMHVAELSKDEPYNKLAYEAKKAVEEIEMIALEAKLEAKFSEDEIQYIEPYTDDSER